MDGDWIPIVMFGCITAVIIFVSSRRHRERVELIKRGKDPYGFKVQSPEKTGSKSLLIGLLVCAIGIALLLSAFFTQDYDRDMITGALLCMFGGGAFLGYWRLTKKDREYARSVHEQQIAKFLESSQADIKEQKTPEVTGNGESVAQS